MYFLIYLLIYLTILLKFCFVFEFRKRIFFLRFCYWKYSVDQRQVNKR